MQDARRSTARPPRRAALLAALLLAACGAGVAAPPATGTNDSAALLRRIESDIGRARCSIDAQCRTLAVGQKPCGGPEAWLPWSTATSNEAALDALARAHADARRREHEASGRMSTCSVLEDPGATCRSGRCVLREAAPAGDPPR